MTGNDRPLDGVKRLLIGVAGAFIPAVVAIVSLMLLSAGTSRLTVAAQNMPTSAGPVCFYKNGHPHCVQRPVPDTLTVPDDVDPERLLRTLLAGPTPQERAQGITSALPPGTRLVSVRADGPAITVRLAFPPGYLEGGRRPSTISRRDPAVLDALACEAIVDQIVDTLLPLGYRDFHVTAQDPTAPDTFRPLSAYLPPITVPSKEVRRPSSVVSRQPGQPPVEVQGQPPGALSGKTVYVSAGHGWQWNGYNWRTQRPPYPDASTGYVGPIIEDHNNAEVVNQYLLRYLRNAGADVWTARERDLNDAEQIVDDRSPGFVAGGDWEIVESSGYLTRYLATTTSLTATAAVTWTTDPLPADGLYALYVWYVPGPDRASEARYTVYHAGGSTELSVDQRHHGRTWRYLGGFPVRGGQRLTVSLSNRSLEAGQVVVAVALRLGGGTFDAGDLAVNGGPVTTTAAYAPDKPWWEVAAFYNVQRLGMDPDAWPYFSDVVARPFWARWEHANTGDDALYVSWHTNGYNGHNDSVWGTSSYIHNYQPVTGSAQLRHVIHSELVNDIRAGWDPAWQDRGELGKDLGELRELWDDDPANAIPGVLLEIAYHDHVTDTNALKDPRFALLSARAVYQGIVKYFETRDGVDLTLLPEPPTHLIARNDGSGQVTVSWRPSPTDSVGLLGDAAQSYRLYTSRDGFGWDDGRIVTGTQHALTGLQENELVFVRVSAVNAGGISFPTPVLAARVSPDGVAQILLVDGFDRIDRHGLLLEDDPTEGINARLFPDRINRYDYVIAHGEAISLPFDSAANEAVVGGDLDLMLYRVVDWILGEESTVDRTFDAAEQIAVAAYLESKGGLFVSGAEIGWDLDAQDNGRDFYRTYLGAQWAGDDADTYSVIPTEAGLFAGLGPIDFRDNYDVDFPDQLTPLAGSVAALSYLGGGGGTAAIQQAAGGCRRVVHLGFPFETIAATKRGAVMERVIAYLGAGGCLSVEPQTAITSPISGQAFNHVPLLAGTAVGFNPIERVEVKISDPQGHYWDGGHWVTASGWLTASGTTAWHYPLPLSITAGSATLLLPQGEYRVEARAWDTAALSDTTPALATFVYDTLSPTMPTLVAPQNRAVLITAPSALVWHGPVSDTGSALAYNLELDGQVLTSPVTAYTPTGQFTSGVHSWRARTYDAAGNRSPWTESWTFVVARHNLYLPLISKAYVQLGTERDLIVNGGFETDGGWDLAATGYPPLYVTSPVHGGQRAIQAWVPPGQAGYSSLAQAVALPDQQPLALTFWYHPRYEDDDTGDLQYVSLTDESGTGHILWLARQDAQQWRVVELDLTLYRGQTVLLRFGARNDGDDATAALIVDDVHLIVTAHR